jgi:hypothetical protein
MDTVHIIPYNAEGSIAAYTIVKGTATGGVLQAAAVGDKLLGVTTDIAAVTGENCDVVINGPTFVKAGGTIAIGDVLTSDASGQAVVAAPSAGTNNRIIGTALEIAASGDVFRASILAGSFQG